MFLLLAVLSCFGWAVAAPASGTCLCVTGTHVNVRNAAGTHSTVLGQVSSGQCFIFNGGVHTLNGFTWYELQHVLGHNRAWIASDYVSTSSASSCSGGSSSSSGGSFATGIVSEACLQCLCVQESGCKPIGCHFDVNSDSCGYFQIKQGYWTDCGSPGTDWKTCANDKHCSSLCVQKYMARYASHYHCPMTCEGFAREHNGGPNGCHHSSTLGYWHGVQSHSGCHNVGK